MNISSTKPFRTDAGPVEVCWNLQLRAHDRAEAEFLAALAWAIASGGSLIAQSDRGESAEIEFEGSENPPEQDRIA